jgi:hypothetical protein
MGVQFEHLTLTPHQSLSFLVEDISRARRDGLFTTGSLDDMQAWLNVLQHWSAPLVSETGRRSIERWLDALDADLPDIAI